MNIIELLVIIILGEIVHYKYSKEYNVKEKYVMFMILPPQLFLLI
jgi:hypothetical protein